VFLSGCENAATSQGGNKGEKVKNEDIDKIRGLGFGADDYLTKPFSPAGSKYIWHGQYFIWKIGNNQFTKW